MEQVLFDAIKAGRRDEVAKIIRETPALLASRDPNGASPLLIAIYHQQLDIAKVLADAKGKIDIFEASALGRVDRLKQLLREDRSVASAYSADGFPVVGLAAFFGHLEAVRTLIAAGANIHAAATNSLKVQAIHAAVASKNIEIVRAVLEAGADPNAAQQQGFRPIHEAGSSGNRELAELLMKYGADPTLKNDTGKTAIDIAREKGHADLADWLARG
ncbi:MAG TPA: ankyrin repeat domain-containing protein [Vicinamibacterales bacterium]|nr:ankyrin repeat domain-containing protein [Vicinamibacterales bacterium]